MKTTYKLGIAALMASVLTYTGCVNNLTDDVDADASVSAAYVARGRTLYTYYIDNTYGYYEVKDLPEDVSWYASNSDTTYVNLTFNMPIDKSTVSGIKVYQLTGTSSTTLYTETPLSFTAIFSNSDKTVTLPLTQQ